MERAATRARCPVASEVSEVSAMRKIGQLQGQRARRPYIGERSIVTIGHGLCCSDMCPNTCARFINDNAADRLAKVRSAPKCHT